MDYVSYAIDRMIAENLKQCYPNKEHYEKCGNFERHVFEYCEKCNYFIGCIDYYWRKKKKTDKEVSEELYNKIEDTIKDFEKK